MIITHGLVTGCVSKIRTSPVRDLWDAHSEIAALRGVSTVYLLPQNGAERLDVNQM